MPQRVAVLYSKKFSFCGFSIRILRFGEGVIGEGLKSIKNFSRPVFGGRLQLSKILFGYLIVI